MVDQRRGRILSLIDLINLAALDKMSREQIEAEVGHIIHDELKIFNEGLLSNQFDVSTGCSLHAPSPSSSSCC